MTMFGRNGGIRLGSGGVTPGSGGVAPGSGGGGGIKERRIAVKCLEMEEMLEKQG